MQGHDCRGTRNRWLCTSPSYCSLSSRAGLCCRLLPPLLALECKGHASAGSRSSTGSSSQIKSSSSPRLPCLSAGWLIAALGMRYNDAERSANLDLLRACLNGPCLRTHKQERRNAHPTKLHVKPSQCFRSH